MKSTDQDPTKFQIGYDDYLWCTVCGGSYFGLPKVRPCCKGKLDGTSSVGAGFGLRFLVCRSDGDLLCCRVDRGTDDEGSVALPPARGVDNGRLCGARWAPADEMYAAAFSGLFGKSCVVPVGPG